MPRARCSIDPLDALGRLLPQRARTRYVNPFPQRDHVLPVQSKDGALAQADQTALGPVEQISRVNMRFVHDQPSFYIAVHATCSSSASPKVPVAEAGGAARRPLQARSSRGARGRRRGLVIRSGDKPLQVLDPGLLSGLAAQCIVVRRPEKRVDEMDQPEEHYRLIREGERE